jgi:hypothetical protein
MAIGEIPSWVRGPNAPEAISSGGAAGLGIARIQQEQQNESQRIGMEAMRLRQASQLEQARLAQAAEQHQMEFEAKRKLAEQNQLREQQRLNIDNAYKTAALGIAQGRLEETQKVAEEKAKNAALQFQREQGFARDVAAGVPVMEAYQRNPVAASVLSAVERSQDTNRPIHVGEAIVRRQPDGTYKEEYRAPSSNKPIKVGKNLVKLNPDGTVKLLYGPGEESKSDILGAAGESSAPQPPGLMSRIKNVFSPSAPPAPPAPTDSKFGHPKVGEVRSGFRFKGGDPNDQKNWEPVKEEE